MVFVKGAAERILDLCDREMAADGTLRPIRPDAALRAAGDLASAGLRVLATAVSWAADPDGFGDQQAHAGNGPAAARWCTRACRRCWIPRARPPQQRWRPLAVPGSR